MINKNLVMLSYGRESEYFRAIFCILSFSAWYKHKLTNTRINVYTDSPDFFRPYLSHLQINFIHLTPDLMESMVAETSYFHRRKVAVIDMTFKQFPGEDVVFLDSDTFIVSANNLLFDPFPSGISYMHRLEYNLADGLNFFSMFNQEEHPKAFVKYISEKEFSVKGEKIKFTTADLCWNSGVLGLNKSFSAYMPDVYKLTDAFYKNSKWFISEQLAFGLIIQRITTILPAEKFVVHYWGKRQKVVFDLLLAQFFQNYPISSLQDNILIKQTTSIWNKKFELDVIMEQAEIAIGQKDWKTSFKKTIQLILKSPFEFSTYQGLYKSISSPN